MQYNFYGMESMRDWITKNGKSVRAHPAEFMGEHVACDSAEEAEEVAKAFSEAWEMDIKYYECGCSDEPEFVYFGERKT